MYIKRKVNIVDLNINLNLPEPVNKSLNPIATAAGETFSNIWSACFSTINLWALNCQVKCNSTE